MTSDDWAEKRARQCLTWAEEQSRTLVANITAALREAKERGRAEWPSQAQAYADDVKALCEDAFQRGRASERALELDAEDKEAEQVHEIWSNAFNSFLISLGIPHDAVDYSPGEDTEGTIGHIVGQAEEHAHRMQQQAVAAERERLLDRLREPDEALVEAICGFVGPDGVDGMYVEGPLNGLLRALAATLADSAGR